MVHFFTFFGWGVVSVRDIFRSVDSSPVRFRNTTTIKSSVSCVISYSCHLLLDFHATTVVSRLKQFGGEFGSSSLRNLVIANKKRRSHPKTVPQCNSTKLGTSLTLDFKMTNNARTTTFRSGNVGDARKVFAHWSQKATTHHCLLSFPILNQLAFRVRGAAT